MSYQTSWLIIIGFVVLVLGIQGGALPWAIGVGIAAFVLVLILFRDWQPASIAGGGVASLILANSAASVLFPGWHHSVLQSLPI